MNFGVKQKEDWWPADYWADGQFWEVVVAVVLLVVLAIVGFLS